MGKSLRRIRERSFVLSLTISAVLVLGTVAASAPANAVDSAAEASPAAVETVVAPAETVADAPASTVEPVAEPAPAAAESVVPAPVALEPAAPALVESVAPAPVVVQPPTVDPALSNLPLDFDLGNIPPNVLTEGTVSGTLTTTIEGSTSPLKWVDVNFYAEGETYPHHGRSTDEAGRYSLSLPAGSYKVSFAEYASSASVVSEYFDNAPDRDSATAVIVTAGGSVIANADLLPDGKTPIPAVKAAIPTIEGDATVGKTLTAHAGTWVPSDVAYTYQWLRGRAPIHLATGPTYAVVNEDQANTLTVVVTGSKQGFYASSGESHPTDVVKTISTPTTAPTPAPTPAPTASPAPAPIVEPTVTLPSSTVGQGGDIVVAGAGYKPFEVVEIWLHSTPVLLGTLTANAQGQIRGSFAIPAGIPVGTHHIVLRDSSGVEVTSAAVAVTSTSTATKAVAVGLASTGADVSGGWVALALLILGALTLGVSARARARSRVRAQGTTEPTFN